MINKKEFAPFIDRLLDNNCAFALWSLPESDKLKLVIAQKEDLVYLSRFDQLNGQKGFVFAPYRISEGSPLVLIKPGVYKAGIDEILQLDPDQFTGAPKDLSSPIARHSSTLDEYLGDIEKTLSVIKNTELAKVIVSRTIPSARKDESLGRIYQQIFNQTPNAFVYMVNLPKAGCWIGATPEVLLKSSGEQMETDSLAGTQSRREDVDYSWHTKEIEEQAFVSRYMLDLFYRFNIHPYSTQGPFTLESGKVAHLKTSFTFPSANIQKRLGEFVADLHPTPAVCGLPKTAADEFIEKIEKHDRRYYTGFLGPWRMEDCVRLFVNLRCMEVLPENYLLYSGGGITSLSIPREEWEETNNKANTLLSAIEIVQNNDFE